MSRTHKGPTLKLVRYDGLGYVVRVTFNAVLSLKNSPAAVSAGNATPDGAKLGALALRLCLINVHNTLSKIKFRCLRKTNSEYK